MTDLFVYRSDKPQVLQAWREACEALQAYVDQTKAVLAAAGLGDYQAYRESRGFDRGEFTGLAVDDDKPVPEGWRVGSDKRYAIPDKRRKAGKDIAAALDAVKHPGSPSQHLLGMPAFLLGAGRMHQPGARLLEGEAALYVQWSIDPEAGSRRHPQFDGTPVDGDLWARVLLSRYYAEAERADAAKAEGGASS